MTSKSSSQGKAERRPPIPRPSSSVILVSPTNQVLLLHRVQTSSSFPSAHVFPGGNVEASDGEMPDPENPDRHVDNLAYRMSAIRETFEESGILLAKNRTTGKLLSWNELERERARKAVHQGEIRFAKWLEDKGGVADTDSLIPFTRWITPPQVPKRYSTQMYLYFLPLPSSECSDPSIGPLPVGAEAVVPTPDGGIEHTAARFLPPQSWIDMAVSGEIILYPPQLFLLVLVAKCLTPVRQDAYSNVELVQHRRQLEQFLKSGDPPWKDVCISPIGMRADGERAVLSLEYPGDEVAHLGRKGVKDYVVLFGRGPHGAPAGLRVMLRKDLPANGDHANL